MTAAARAEEDETRRRLIGGRVAQVRREAGLTQKELAERIGATLGQIVKLEEGRTDPSPLLPRVAAVTDRSVDLFGGDPPREQTSRDTDSEVAVLASRIDKLEEDLRAIAGRLGNLQSSLASLHARFDRLASELHDRRTEGNLPGQPRTVDRGENTVLRREREMPALPEPPARSSRRRYLLMSGVVVALAALAVLGFVLADRAQRVGSRPLTASSLTPQAHQKTVATVTAVRPPAPKHRAFLTPQRTPVLVLNGNGLAGAAAREAALVKQLGYPVSRVGNAQSQDYARTVVGYRTGLRREALTLARKLDVRTVSLLTGTPPSELGAAKLVVITGLQ